MTSARKTLTILAILVMLLLVSGGLVISGLFDPEYETSAVDRSDAAIDMRLLARGKYLVQAGDCAACHTAKDGAPYAGGVPIPTPFGTIYGTNITPDEEYGIGTWNSADFFKALHDGIAPEHPLYPAMPYTSYRSIHRADSDAMFAYLQSIEPAPVPEKNNRLPFPFNLRPLMRGWNLLFLTDTLPAVTQGESELWLRGRYLANALGHCTECHTPRGAFGQLKLDESFEGGAAEAIHAPDITSRALAARGWNSQGLRQFLARGVAPQGSAYGGMYDAFHNSTRYLSTQDNQAMVAYLLGDNAPRPEAVATPSKDEASRQQAGRGHYLALCAGCHAAQGQGKPNVAVALAGNSTVRNQDPHNMMEVILHGLDAKAFPDGQDRQAMPGFASMLTDAQLAELVNYLRVNFGGQPANVTAQAVQSLRR